MADLTHHESHVLALILKWQPTTAYFVRKTLERGLASSFSGSPGSVYAIVERLRRREFVAAAPDPEDGRGTELLTCTDAGVAAVKTWIATIKPADLLPEDPWRTRMAFAEVLDGEEQLNWLLAMREAAGREAAALAARADAMLEESQLAAVENARLLTEARLNWIDRTLARRIKSR